MKCRLVNKEINQDYTRELLKERGIKDVELYLNPTKECLQDPKYLSNIDEGASLFLSKIGPGKTVFLVQDSDCDGLSSGGIAYQYIKDVAPETEIKVFIHEGKQHGLEDCVERILDEDKIDLVIAPDSSSNDKIYADELGEAGIPVLVLDHHIVDNEISKNMIVVNNQISSEYINKELTGSGVTYQFCRYVDQLLGRTGVEKYIDLAALGICGDMGSLLTMENRYFMVEGFSHVNNYFLQCLIKKQSYSMNDTVNPTTVAFFIVPLINAMIRVGTMEEKERLFMAIVDGHTKVPSHKRGANGEYEEVAVESVRECVNARTRQNKIKERAMESLEIKILNNNLLDNKILFVELDDDDDIPSVLTGLVAMGLVTKYKKPTLIGRLNDEGFIRGSARGPNNTELDSLKDFLGETGLFEYASGHDQAFGWSLPKRSLEKFQTYSNKELSSIDFGEGVYDVNFERFSNDSDLKELIEDLADNEDLWGQNNSQPLIHVKGLNLTKNEIQVIGSKKDTIKFEKGGIVYIKFHATDMIEDLKQYDTMNLEIVGHANINEWMGRRTPQIFIDNYEIKQDLFAF